MDEHHRPFSFEPVPIPVRDPDSLSLSIIGLNEVVPRRKSSGVFAVTGQVVDLAVRGHIQIEEGASGQYSLHKMDGAQDSLLPEEERLLSILFTGREAQDRARIAELACDPYFMPSVRTLQEQTRKRLKQGKEPYISLAPDILQKLKVPIIIGSLATAGVSFYEGYPVVGIAAAGVAAIETFSPVSDIVGTMRRPMNGDIAVQAMDSFLRAARPHISNYSEVMHYLTEEASPEALAALRSNRQLLANYERALGYLKIMKMAGIALFWATELAHLCSTTPAWFRPNQPSAPYDPVILSVSLCGFLRNMDSVLEKRRIYT